jgi:hypothetical protein
VGVVALGEVGFRGVSARGGGSAGVFGFQLFMFSWLGLEFLERGLG